VRDILVSASAGAALVIIGSLMIRAHRRAWSDQKNDPDLPDADRIYFHRRYRRRMQTSSMMVVVGILLGLGGAVIPWQNFRPLVWTAYWWGVLLLTFWMVLQALGDLFSTRVRAQATLEEVRRKRHELERQIEQYKSRRSNGKHHHD